MQKMNNSDASLSLPPDIDGAAISFSDGGVSDVRSIERPEPRGKLPAFAPGDLLANRFRILRFLARGGMGEVYEAEDLELREALALKTLLPAIAHDERVLALLKAEVLLARKVTHPNVCRIFDLSCHRSVTEGGLPVWFVTMELLQGNTLSREIQELGKLPLERVLPIAEQMASGLEAARKANVVHGDFKSSNVILVRSSDSRLRAVITDFGLARTIEAAQDSRAARVGTPAYMAPEQVKGEALSPQTDVYSFGVVLYEMVTGQWPFNADSPEAIAKKRLMEAPVPPIRYAPKLEPVWNRMILKCLALNPRERYSSAVDAIDEVTGRSRWRTGAIAAALLILFMGSGIVGLARHNEIGPFKPKPQIAVIGWRNRSADKETQWIASELSERLSHLLEQSTNDLVIPQQDVDNAEIEFYVPTNRDLDKEDLSQFRAALGANSFVIGSYEVRGGSLIVDGAMQNARGRTLAHFHEVGTPDSLPDIVKNVAATLTLKLDSKEFSEEAIDRLAKIYPRGIDARRLYFEALARLHAFDADSARVKLEQVVALEVSSVAAHSALAEAWFRLRHDREAAEQGEIAARLAHAQDLPAEIVQSIKARSEELSQHWSVAADRYKSLHNFFPEKLTYSLSYAAALTKSGHPANSLQFLDSIAKEPSPVGDDPRIQFARADALASSSDFSEELKAARLSLSYAVQRGEKLMKAAAELQVCWAQQNTGHLPEATEACQDAYIVYATFEDAVSAVVALNGLANIKMKQADYRAARDTYRQVLGVTQRASAEVDTCGALLNLAKSEIYLGDTKESEGQLQQAIGLAQKTEDHGDEGRARILLAQVFIDAGKSEKAKEQDTLALKIGEATEDRDVQAYALSNLGSIALDAQSLPSAEAYFRKSLALREAMGEPAGIINIQLRLSSLLLTRKDVAGARTLAEKALESANHLRDDDSIAAALCALAEADIAIGDFGAAIKKSSRAADIYHALNDPDSQANALLLNARSLLKQKDLLGSAREVAMARSLSGVSQSTLEAAASLESVIAKRKLH